LKRDFTRTAFPPRGNGPQSDEIGFGGGFIRDTWNGRADSLSAYFRSPNVRRGVSKKNKPAGGVKIVVRFARRTVFAVGVDGWRLMYYGTANAKFHLSYGTTRAGFY